MRQDYEQEQRKNYQKEQLNHELRLAKFNIERARIFSERAGEHTKAAARLYESVYGVVIDEP